MSEPLHFRLASGRVLLLEVPLTPEELEEVSTPEGMAILERLADVIAQRATRTVAAGDAEYEELVRRHLLEP